MREQQAAVQASDDPAVLLQAAADLLRCPVEDVVSRAEALAAEVKRLEAVAEAQRLEAAKREFWRL